MQGADILGGIAVEYGAVKKMEKKEIKGEKEKIIVKIVLIFQS